MLYRQFCKLANTKTVTYPKLLNIIVSPELLPTLGPAAQGQVIREARYTALLGTLEAQIDSTNVEGKLADHLTGAKLVAQYYDTQIKWETRCLDKALEGLTGPVVLLKGAAYKLLDLGVAEGRMASDVDLLLPHDQLEAAERALMSSGWEPMKEDEYEQNYYRQWMHELPPLRHSERGTIVDLHHTILPPTARFKPDVNKLLDAVIPIENCGFYAFSPADALLHRCAHLFIDGDLHNSLRELVDIRGLLIACTGEDGLDPTLLSRAQELDLSLPLYYALYFCDRLLQWEVPAGFLDTLKERIGLSPLLTRSLMEQQLISVDPTESTWQQRLAGEILFLRSHWLRMPPAMLVKHLARQAWHRGGLKAG